MIFSSRRFLQKTNEQILLYYLMWNLRLTCFRMFFDSSNYGFLEEIEDTKKTFQNYLTFSLYISSSVRNYQIISMKFFNTYVQSWIKVFSFKFYIAKHFAFWMKSMIDDCWWLKENDSNLLVDQWISILITPVTI
jgi:hypothetical protein